MQWAVCQFPSDDSHFSNGHAAQIINHHRQTAGFRQCRHQFIDHQSHHLRTVLGIDNRGAWLAVNAHAQFGMARMMARCGVGFLRQMATGNGDAQAEGVTCCILRFTQDGSEVVATFSEIACHFMNQDSARNPARMLVIRQGDIVADNQHFDVIAKATRFFGGETEVKTVAGVIFNDQQTACFASYRLDCGQHGIYARGRKHVATDCRGQHPFADKANVSGFVS